MEGTAIQLYTLRDLEESVPALLSRVAETTFDGVEFAGLGETDPETAADVLDDAGLEAAGVHVGIESLEDDPNGVRETCTALDCEHVVVPYLDDRHFATAEAVRETAARLEGLADRLEEDGLTLGYHNHDHEFVDVPGDDRTAFEVLVDETDDDVTIELDVGWAAAAGHDPVALLERLEGRVPLVHLKDVADGVPVELGDGEVDVVACAQAARSSGTEWLVYEHDDPADPASSLARGAATLTELRD